MKTDKKILTAFILNLAFSIFEVIGGIVTGSVSIISDSIHDLGDAASIGISYFLERKSKHKPDERYTYGYARYSVLGGLITTLILLVGSGVVICNAIFRIISPIKIDYNGMIVFSIIGVAVNLCATLFTSRGESLNQKAVNLHMLEDTLGWIVVLVGAIIMKFTDFSLLDPILSICVAVFIFINAAKNLKEIFYPLLEKAPDNINIGELKDHLSEIDGVIDVHHIHIWSMDGQNICITMHVVVGNEVSDISRVKGEVRAELSEHGIGHATLELEAEGEPCPAPVCPEDIKFECGHRHHRHVHKH